MSQQVESNSSELRCVGFLATSDLYPRCCSNLLCVAVLTLSCNKFPVGHMLLPVAIYIYICIYTYTYIYMYIYMPYICCWFPGVLKSSFNERPSDLTLCVAVFKISNFTI